MRLIAADDIGLVKEVDLSSKSSRYISSVSGGDLAVECLCWIDDSSSLLAVARLNGSVDLFRRDSREWTLKRTYELDSTPLRMIMLNSTLLLLSDSRLSNDFDRLRLPLYWGRIAKAKAIDQGHPVCSGKKAKETTSGTSRATNLAKAAAA
jgi:hypothetical protein